MALFVQPPLYCPFPSAINVHAATVQYATLKWAHHFGLIRGERAAQRLNSRYYGELMARAYPHARLESLQLVSDWNTWLFFLDDQCDETGLGNAPSKLAQVHACLLAILRGAAPSADDGPQSRALWDLTNRLYAQAGEAWLRRFSSRVEEYFAANVWEATNRLQGTMPDVATYRAMRPFTGAVYTYLQLIEFTEQLDLPPAVHNHADVHRLAQMTNNCICWSNDIISLEKELRHGDVHNLVLILRSEQNLTIQAAVDQVAALHNAEVRAFTALAARPPSFGAGVDADIRRYIRGMQHWMRANLDWSAATTRYRLAAQQAQHAGEGQAPAAWPRQTRPLGMA